MHRGPNFVDRLWSYLAAKRSRHEIVFVRYKGQQGGRHYEGGEAGGEEEDEAAEEVSKKQIVKILDLLRPVNRERSSGRNKMYSNHK